MKEKVIAVVGAGVMGSDIALDLSSYNYKVILKDIDDDLLQRAEKRIRKNFKLMKLIKKNFATSSIDEILSRIMFATDYVGFEKVAMVIENIPEVYEQKKCLYIELKDVCKEDVTYGTNTSCISITKIASHMPKPENIIGMHFLNPAPLKKLVEIIRGFHTSEETIERTKKFLTSIEKAWVVVNDLPGFVTN